MFNWTMTYHRNADIWFPYGYFEKLKNKRENSFFRINENSYSEDVDLDAIWKMKNYKLPYVSWFVSNCWTKNRRLEIVSRLQLKGLQVSRVLENEKLQLRKINETRSKSDSFNYVNENFWKYEFMS